MKTTIVLTSLFSLLFGTTLVLKADPNGPGGQNFYLDLTQAQNYELLTNMVWTPEGLMPLRKNQPALFQSKVFQIELDRLGQFQTFASSVKLTNFNEELFELFVSFSPDGIEWGPWQSAHPDHEATPTDSSFTTELLFISTGETYFRYLLQFSANTGGQPVVKVQGINSRMFSPGNTQPIGVDDVRNHPLYAVNQDCQCPLPAHAQRTDWGCPDGQDPSCASPAYAPVTHMIVHHSATPNNSNNWAATVLSIWDFHVNVNGWCDIGYNWVIDPNGVIYEARGGGNNVRGAHFCGTNTGTMGICMLGTYTSEPPTDAALNSLQKLLTWKSCDAIVDPTGTSFHASSGLNLPVIAGHQDGCNTICPGDSLYPLLGEIRANVADSLDACSTVASNDLKEASSPFVLAPNPSDGQLTVSWETPLQTPAAMNVFSSTGQRVWQQQLPAFGIRQAQLELGHLSKGVYLLEFQQENRVIRKKILLTP